MRSPSRNHERPGLTAALESSADARLRRSYTNIVWGAIVVSTALHFAFFYWMPGFRTQEITTHAAALEKIELPPEVKIPPAPKAIARPAVPVAAPTGAIDQDITIAPTTFEMNPVTELPPPPTEKKTEDISETPTFTPYTVQPDIVNRDEVRRVLQAKYPSLLRNAGIGGTVLVWFFIDTKGRVENTKVRESSGHHALDEAALEVANVFRFSPALNRDKKVPVWIALPIRFEPPRQAGG